MYVSKVYEMAVDAYGDVRTLVRGLPYQCPDDWEDVLDSLDEDSNLYLIKEPDNPKDKLAIAAYLDDRRVGYVAASDNGKIWLYMTDEKMPCTFIERFDASFKISFDNPRPLFEGMPFKEIYKDKFGVTEQPFPAFDIPFLSNPKDKRFEWFDDRVYIADLERAIPDFRRKLATRMIILAGRKDSKGEYHYYLPFANNPIADVEDDIIKGIIDRYGFVIALPDVPMINAHGGILMDLHVTFLKNTNFMDFNSEHQSELVFSLVRENEYKYKFAEDNPSASGRNDDDDGNQNDALEEIDMFMQEPQSTPSYSKSDYILKKGEVATSSIDKSTFTEIDKIASELFSFVRQTLFPSIELFSYLKKHTPYYNQFYDFGQFETLIRVLVIKDLGRIYKGLNHSFNFETAEGKPLFLYMEKDVGESSETSYEAFNEICNPKTRLEAATKMRGVIENLMKSFYEYDIALWTDTDFIIHSTLKEVDNELAKRYMELMRQFASAVADANGDLSANLPGGSPYTLNDFFPLYGVTLGETTWKQAEEMGYVVEMEKDGLGRSIDAEDVGFYDDNGRGVFTSICWCQNDKDFPPSWQSKGFSWDNSYDDWMDVFKKLRFDVRVTKQPTQDEFSGHKTLSAKFGALSPDSMLLFDLVFDYGGNGYDTSSPKTLAAIHVRYNGLVKRGGSTPSAIKDFFPLFGITLGETTWKQAEDMGHVVEINKESSGRNITVNKVSFWDHRGNGIFTSLYWYRSYVIIDFPLLWKSKGFSWDNSYDQWMDVFKKLGYIITVKRQPSQKEYTGRKVLTAEFEALSSDGSLLFKLDFDYGKNGYLTSSPKTLYSINVYYEGPTTSKIAQMKSELNEKTPAKQNHEGEYYSVSDSPEGGKHVSMDVILPEDDDPDFDFYSYECRISDKKQIDLITEYMKRFEDGKESRSFLMIGRPCFGLDNVDSFYSLDGEILFNFIFDDKIKRWIREAGFVWGKVKSYNQDAIFPEQLAITLSVSKRKGGETLFKQASEEAMDYIEVYCSSQADQEVEAVIIDAVEKYMSGDSAISYKVVIVSQYGIGACTTLDGEDVAIIVDDKVIELAEKNKGVFGYITKVDYDDDGDAWFTIRISRSIPRLTLEQETDVVDGIEVEPESSATEEQGSRPPSISEEVFAKFISENIGCDILNAPNSSWSYDTTDFLGNGRDMYETYIFKKRVPNNLKCSEIQANVVKGKSVNFCLDIKMNKREIYDFVYRYKKLFYPDYTFAKCKKEYASEQFSIYTEGITPSLDIRFPFMGDPCSMVFYTSFCNTAYIEKKKEQKKILTLEK